MFEPRNCFKGALLVWLIAAMRFHSALAGLAFAAVPFGLGVKGLLERWRG